MNSKTLARLAVYAVIAAVLALATACGPSHGNASPAASSAQAEVGSITANPQVQHEIDQARDLVKTCFAGTPLQQIHQVHLVLLSSATGKNGPAVVAARDKTFTCLGIPPDQRDNFKNAAITAAEQQRPRVATKAGVVKYVTLTLPQIVLKSKGVPASPVPAVTSGSPA